MILYLENLENFTSLFLIGMFYTTSKTVKGSHWLAEIIKLTTFYK